MKKLYSIFLGIILFCSFSHAEIFYVSTMGNDSNDGKSWETAYANVQTAIDAAAKVATSSSPAQVWVAKGTYAHGSEILVEVGQTVKRGNPVLKVGSTGYSTGAHAHFEVRLNGVVTDPMPYITNGLVPQTQTNEETGENETNQ